MSTDNERVQSVRNAWINRMRKEALDQKRAEVSACIQIGVWIATYADADGSNAFPSAETLADIVHSTDETVGRAIKVLIAVGLIQRKRRPNLSSMYQLVTPVGPVNWDEHLHLYTDTRQKRRKAEQKKKAIAELLAKQEEKGRTTFHTGVRTAVRNGEEKGSDTVVDRSPDTVSAGVSRESGHRSGTGTDTVLERISYTVPAGGDQYLPTSGRDPLPGPRHVEPVPRPTVRVGARGEDDLSPAEDERPGRRCVGPGCRLPLLRPGRKLCYGCEQLAKNAPVQPQGPVQGAFTMAVPTWPAPQPREDLTAPVRACGCGREYRGQKPGRCWNCLAAEQGQTA